MSNEQTVAQARFIASAGRKLKDHIFFIQSGLRHGRVSCQGEELSIAQVQMLMTLQSYGENTISHLAERLKVSPPSASCMVDSLEDKGFLQSRAEYTRSKKGGGSSFKAGDSAG